MRPFRRRSSCALVCATLIGAMIAGLQWMLLDSTRLAPVDLVRAVTLGVPAFLAGATLVRLARAIDAAVGRYRRRHRILHADERGERR